MFTEGTKVEIAFNKASQEELAKNPDKYQMHAEKGVIESFCKEADIRFGGVRSYYVRVFTDGSASGRLRVIPETKLRAA